VLCCHDEASSLKNFSRLSYLSYPPHFLGLLRVGGIGQLPARQPPGTSDGFSDSWFFSSPILAANYDLLRTAAIESLHPARFTVANRLDFGNALHYAAIHKENDVWNAN
jgi:hypothetical protein